MTAIVHSMPPQETQRQRYSRELAEYTYRQWEMARRALELASSSPRRQPDGSPNPQAVDNSKSQQVAKGRNTYF